MDKLSREEKKWFRRVKLISEEVKDIIIIAGFLAITLGGMGLVLWVINKFGSN